MYLRERASDIEETTMEVVMLKDIGNNRLHWRCLVTLLEFRACVKLRSRKEREREKQN
jgi:hypothetical protein